MSAANRRYLEFLSALEDDSSGRREIERVTKRTQDATGRSHREINFFLPADLKLAWAILRGENVISGLTARRLRRQLPAWSGSQISRALRRFCEHSLLKKIGGTFKYYITQLGLKVMTAALRLREGAYHPDASGLSFFR